MARRRYNLLVLFGVGMLWDALITADTVLAAHGFWLGVVFTTAAITVIGPLTYNNIIDPAGLKRSKLAALAAGSGVGAGLATWLLAT